jgi:hypothetical protein
MLLTSNQPRTKRRGLVWLFVCLCVPVLLLFGAFCLSLFKPLRLTVGDFHLKCGVQKVDPSYGIGNHFFPGLVQVQAGEWVYYVINWSSPYTVDRLRTKIRAEIPLGSTVGKVQQWLDKESIAHSYHSTRHSNLLELQGYSADQLGGIAQGSIPEMQQTLPETEQTFLAADIALLFFFDKKGKLIGYSVEEEWAGP